MFSCVYDCDYWRVVILFWNRNGNDDPKEICREPLFEIFLFFNSKEFAIAIGIVKLIADVNRPQCYLQHTTETFYLNQKFVTNVEQSFRTLQDMLLSVLTLGILTQCGATGAESDVSTVVGCAACRYASWPHDAWECDVKCNVAPSGVLTYGKFGFCRFYLVVMF